MNIYDRSKVIQIHPQSVPCWAWAEKKKPFDIVWLTEGLDVLRMFSFTCGCLVIVSQPVAGLDDARWLDGVRVSIVFHMIPSGKLT